MSQNTVTTIVYVVIALVALIAEQFKFVPAGTADFVIGIVGLHAVGTGVVLPTVQAIKTPSASVIQPVASVPTQQATGTSTTPVRG